MGQDEIAVIFGRILRKLRRDLDISQDALGAKAGFKATYISTLERGLRTPTLKTMIKLCDALSISLVELSSLIQQKLKF